MWIIITGGLVFHWDQFYMSRHKVDDEINSSQDQFYHRKMKQTLSSYMGKYIYM